MDLTGCLYCIAFRATLKVETCARRHALANGAEDGSGSFRDSACRGCTTGDITEGQVTPKPREGTTRKKTLNPKVCGACGEIYRPTGGRQLTCGKCQATGARSIAGAGWRRIQKLKGYQELTQETLEIMSAETKAKIRLAKQKP